MAGAGEEVQRPPPGIDPPKAPPPPWVRTLGTPGGGGAEDEGSGLDSTIRTEEYEDDFEDDIEVEEADDELLQSPPRAPDKQPKVRISVTGLGQFWEQRASSRAPEGAADAAAAG